MKKEESFLIAICKAYLTGSDVDIPTDMDWKELYKLTRHHNLLGICYCVLNISKQKFNIPGGFMTAVENKFFDLVYLYQCQTNCMDEVNDLFTSSEIRYILFKGAILRNSYPVPESRAMGDIDLLIDKVNRDKVKKILTNAGFICTEQNGPVYNYRRNNVLLEVHTRIISEFGDDAFCDAFENARFDDYKGILNDNYHMAYLISHIAHHFKFYGAGIRHVLDLAVMQQKKDIDLDVVMDMLKPIGLDTFGRVILSVCYEWFGIGRQFVDNTEKTQRYLCKSGVFGAMNENKGAIVTRKELEKSGKSSSFIVKLKLAFPPYERLKNIDYIRFIEGRPWLTPYAWCYRFFYNLKHRKSFMTKTISEIDNKETQQLAKTELDYFEEIGL
ncbi:MAG: nucleotidyltransferase family protein [Eubacterium sp.]|nr:nucleotidyltransferase family protein [Eubacterium sp.]